MADYDFEPEIDDTEDLEDPDWYYDFWAEHEKHCDGCPTCNPTAFRDEE
ncbi:MAG: hypothetical protein KW804_02545 [Candidatus Doudnabacteria bacterium]|nr:hypothetical protein [Candidatus Doudnabacteria bacterium]